MEKEPASRPDKDDQDWFALLQGQAAPAAHPDTVQEAQALRRAVQAGSAPPGADPAVEQAGLERLLFDLRREGLLRPRRPWWQRLQVWPVVAAAMLVLALQLPNLYQKLSPWTLPGAQPVPKGLQLPQMLYASEPLSQARTLQTALTAVGLTVQHLDQGNSQVLRAELPRPVPEAIREVLKKYDLTIPEDGKLVVQILAKGQ